MRASTAFSIDTCMACLNCRTHCLRCRPMLLLIALASCLPRSAGHNSRIASMNSRACFKKLDSFGTPVQETGLYLFFCWILGLHGASCKWQCAHLSTNLSSNHGSCLLCSQRHQPLNDAPCRLVSPVFGKIITLAFRLCTDLKSFEASEPVFRRWLGRRGLPKTQMCVVSPKHKCVDAGSAVAACHKSRAPNPSCRNSGTAERKVAHGVVAPRAHGDVEEDR